MGIHQFAFHARVPAEPPECEAFTLYRRLAAGGTLSREDKDRIAQLCYGVSTSHSSTYQRGGWECRFAEVCPCYIVQQGGQLAYYWAPDATSLRTALYGRIERMFKVEGNRAVEQNEDEDDE